MTSRLPSLLLLAPLFCLPAAPLRPAASLPDPKAAADLRQEAEPEVDVEARLLELAELAAVAVAEHYGEDPSVHPVAVEVVSRRDLERTLRDDLLPQMELQFGAGAMARAQSRAFARNVGTALIARFSWSADRIHICAENLEGIAELFGDPSVTDEAVVRAVLVHEYVHARDHRVHDLEQLLNGAADVNDLQARNAVVEGHAQYVARRICAAQGWHEGFARFTHLIDAVPSGIDDPFQRLAIEITNRSFTFSYKDGERFLDALVRAGQDGARASAEVEVEGEAEAADEDGLAAKLAEAEAGALAGAFRSPPSDPLVVLRPHWYLDPSSRPPLRYDADAGLDRYVELACTDDYLLQRQDFQFSQLPAIFAGLPQEDLDRFLAGFLACRMQTGSDPAVPGKVRSALVWEFDSESAAVHALAFERALLEHRDATMTEGSAIIRSAEYTDLALEDGQAGLTSAKVVEVPGSEVRVSLVLLQQGSAMVELTSIAEPEELPVIVEWARATLAAAHGAGAPDEGDSPTAGSDGEETER